MSRMRSRVAAAGLASLLASVVGLGLTTGEAMAKGRHHAIARHRNRHTAAAVRSNVVTNDSNAQSAVGDFFSGPFHFQFTASRPANEPATDATGNLTATLDLLGANLTTVSGPVTCLDVVGRRAGIFYPITAASPFVLLLLRGVILSVQLSDTGRPQSIMYVPLISQVNSCAPLPGVLPITSGTLTLTS